MSFWNKLLGKSNDKNLPTEKEESLPMEQPENEITKRPPDDLTVASHQQDEVETKIEENNLDNKDSP